jgi:putative ABC transport system permease protein
MSVLDRKLLRDLWRLKTQVLAIALVMAAGVAILVIGVGTHQSLQETQTAYYERQRFADVFATVRRAPERLRSEIAEIPGVAAVETRIVEAAILDIEGVLEPASAQLVSVPDDHDQVLNALHIRLGRMPEPAHPDEVVVNETFAEAHGFTVGSRFGAIINGRQRQLEIVGIALSPEFIYTLAPGAWVPDDRLFGIVWMSRRALAAAFDLDGAFSEISLRLLAEVSEDEAIERIDELLERYGGRGAHGRDEQRSHADLDERIQRFEALSTVLPPIFLLVAAFLVNMTLTRLVALEREQIGLMKALGYGSFEVAWHYVKFVIAIAAVGVAVGLVAGAWLGRELAILFSQFFRFPLLIFHIDASVYVIAAGVTVVAAVLGAARAIASVAGLSPAVAMQPPAPPSYRRGFGATVLGRLSHSSVMVARNITRWPLRAGFTVVGIALSVAILVGSLFLQDSIDAMIDATFFQSQRQDATISFVRERPFGALSDVERLPGVMAAEPMRTVAARLTHGPVSRRLAIQGLPPDADLARLLDVDHQTVRLPETGIVLDDMLARILGLRVGDLVEVETLEGRRRVVDIPVTAIVQSYVGMAGYMDITAVNRLMREGEMIGAVHIKLDPRQETALYEAIKETPMVAAVSLQRRALDMLREIMDENIGVMTTVFAAFALVVAFGVVYNSARIQLSERARELATLRVLGFTRAEVSWILLGELALLTVVALPLGWIIGYGLALAMVQGFETELYRFPLVIERATYAWAAIIVVVGAAVSALLVRRRIDRFDLVEVLKTRE